jgi:hypothetical protein
MHACMCCTHSPACSAAITALAPLTLSPRRRALSPGELSYGFKQRHHQPYTVTAHSDSHRSAGSKLACVSICARARAWRRTTPQSTAVLAQSRTVHRTPSPYRLHIARWRSTSRQHTPNACAFVGDLWSEPPHSPHATRRRHMHGFTAPFHVRSYHHTTTARACRCMPSARASAARAMATTGTTRTERRTDRRTVAPIVCTAAVGLASAAYGAGLLPYGAGILVQSLTRPSKPALSRPCPS